MLANFLELVFALSAYALELRSMELELRSMEHHRGLELRSTSKERLEQLIGGRRRERGRCCWPRPYLGADANAEGGEEEKGTTHLRQHLDREAADIVGKIDTICTLQSILATAFGRVVTADLRRDTPR